MRSHDNSKFYLIATDLKLYGNGNWTRAQTAGSQSIMIWESSDLINWSEQRMVKVAPEGAGCVWAPEAVYNDKKGEYVVFWSSTHGNDKLHKVYYTTTKDFLKFGETKLWMELKNENGKVISVIDTSVIKVGNIYYRFKKNESFEAHKKGMPSSGKYIIMEKSIDLFGNWEEINSEMSQIKFVEGAAIFKLNDENKWYLFLDNFAGDGYFPLVSTDLSTGAFTELNYDQYSLPSIMRHGSIIRLTEDEYQVVVNKYA